MPNKKPSRKAKQGVRGNMVPQKNSGKFKQQNLIRPSTSTPAKDDDGNGLVDGSEITAYQLYNSSNPLFISTKSGKKFSNKTSTEWSILEAAPEKQGHLALVNNNQSRKDHKGRKDIAECLIRRTLIQHFLCERLRRPEVQVIFNRHHHVV